MNESPIPNPQSLFSKRQAPGFGVRVWDARTASASYLPSPGSSHLASLMGRRHAVRAGVRGQGAGASKTAQLPRLVYACPSGDASEKHYFPLPCPIDHPYCLIVAFYCLLAPSSLLAAYSPPSDGKAARPDRPIWPLGGSGDARMRSRALFISWRFAQSRQFVGQGRGESPESGAESFEAEKTRRWSEAPSGFLPAHEKKRPQNMGLCGRSRLRIGKSSEHLYYRSKGTIVKPKVGADGIRTHEPLFGRFPDSQSGALGLSATAPVVGHALEPYASVHRPPPVSTEHLSPLKHRSMGIRRGYLTTVEAFGQHADIPPAEILPKRSPPVRRCTASHASQRAPARGFFHAKPHRGFHVSDSDLKLIGAWPVLARVGDLWPLPGRSSSIPATGHAPRSFPQKPRVD